MVFNVYNESLVRVGEISSIVSSTWQECYNDRGICQLVVTETEQTSRMFQVGYWIGKSDKTTLWQIRTKEKREGAIWLNGFTANYCLLDDRVYNGLHTSNVVETDLRTAVSTMRPAPIVGLDTANGLTGSVVSEHTYPTLFALSKDLCGSVEYGFRFRHDRQNKKLLFNVYQGQQKPNAKFSEKFGNLSNLMLQQSETNYKNVAYVGGGDEGADRVFVVCGDTASTGLARHEIFVDARDVRKTDDITDEQYINLLKERGLQKLNQYNKKLAVSFDVDADDYGKTYNLGDIIYCILPEDMLKLFVRVIAFEETVENNSTTISVTVGSPIIQTIGRI